jgi:hypothetical protein
VISAKGNKVRFAVTLQVRKLATIESFRHNSRGDSRPRLSGGAKLRILESYRMRLSMGGLVSRLNVKTISNRETVWDQNSHVGTAALGCPAERSSAGWDCCRVSLPTAGLFRWIAGRSNRTIHVMRKNRRVALARTAEGGCPHVVIATCRRLGR